MKPNAQCPTCLQYMHAKELNANYECPNKVCGSKVWPKLLQSNAIITINWDDLRALTYYASMWVDEKCMGSHERASILNVINLLEAQRKVLIKQTGRPSDFGPLTPFIEGRELKKNSSVNNEKDKGNNDENTFGGFSMLT